jgi:uncharacterized membrane protein
MTEREIPSRTSEWRAPLALIALCAIPLLAGAVRLGTLATGAAITPENARFVGAPLPVVLHVLSVATFIVLGAFQFVPGIRRRSPAWHRRVGRLLVVAGLVAALSGLWMSQFYALPAHDGVLLYGFRMFFGTLMAISILVAFAAIRRREVNRHRAWMMRAYAIGLGAGTQALMLMVGEIILGPPGTLARGLLMGGAWVINLAVAEWIIRRQRSRPVRTAGTASPNRSDQGLVASAPSGVGTLVPAQPAGGDPRLEGRGAAWVRSWRRGRQASHL